MHLTEWLRNRWLTPEQLGQLKAELDLARDAVYRRWEKEKAWEASSVGAERLTTPTRGSTCAGDGR
jgi:hypothetical protein